MYIAMNRFHIRPGEEETFENIWKQRESRLRELPGFRSFRLLRGESQEEFTLFASHTIWDSEAAFQAWTKSEAFRQAHKNAGAHNNVYLGHPRFEGFQEVPGTAESAE
ncbi:antibiotic biosynthesis monooxygenase [Wenzhouxiangella sp. XN24]|nr:antibiotic biosynthesis monooxygenase [Wenzhouxiangella sp. XN24]